MFMAERTARESPDKDLRSPIVDTILSEGGDATTGYYLGNFRAIERKFKVPPCVPKRI